MYYRILAALSFYLFGWGIVASSEETTNIIGHVSVRSFDELSEISKSNLLPLPEWLTPAGIERVIPLFPKDSISTTKPIGAFLIWRSNTVAPYIALPIKNVEQIIKLLDSSGYKNVPGKPEVYRVNDSLFVRVVAGYVVWGREDAALLSLAPARLSKLFPESRKRSLVFTLSTLPKDSFGNSDNTKVLKSLFPKLDDAALGYLGNFWEGVAKNISGALLFTDEDIVLELSCLGVTPLKMPMPKLALPEGSPVQLRLGMSEFTREALTGYLSSAAGELLKGQAAGIEAQKAEAVMGKLMKFMFTADGVSVGVEWQQNALYTYITRQYEGEYDAGRTLAEIVAELKSLKEFSGTEPLVIKEHSLSDKLKFTRVQFQNGFDTVLYYDFVQIGRTVYATLSDMPGVVIHRMMSSKPSGSFAGGVELDIDVGGFLQVLAQNPESMFSPLKSALKKEKGNLFANMRPKVRVKFMPAGVLLRAELPRKVSTDIARTLVFMNFAQKGDANVARVEFAKARALQYQSSVIAKLELAMAVARAGDLKLAKEIAVAAQKLNPKSLRSMRMLGDIALIDSRFEEAFVHYKNAALISARSSLSELMMLAVSAMSIPNGEAKNKAVAILNELLGRVLVGGGNPELLVLRYLMGNLSLAELTKNMPDDANDAILAQMHLAIAIRAKLSGNLWGQLTALEKRVALSEVRPLIAMYAAKELLQPKAQFAIWEKERNAITSNIKAGKLSEAWAVAERAFPLAGKLGNVSPPVGITLMLASQIKMAQNEYKAVVILAMKAREILSKSEAEFQALVARLDNDIAIALFKQNKLNDALPIFLRSAKIYKSLGKRGLVGLSQALLNYATVATQLEDYEVAIQALAERLEVDRIKNAYDKMVYDLRTMSMLAEKLGQPEKALQFKQMADSLVERLKVGR